MFMDFEIMSVFRLKIHPVKIFVYWLSILVLTCDLHNYINSCYRLSYEISKIKCKYEY